MRSNVIYECNDCNVVLHTKFDLLEHRNIHTGETPFMCVYCRKCFELIKQYIVHIKGTHLFEGKLGQSGIEVDGSSKNKKDGITEEPEPAADDMNIAIIPEKNTSKTYTCTKCLKVFVESEELKNHICKHPTKGIKIGTSQATKYYCKICKVTFNSFKKYQLHKKNLHNFVCGNCNKKFITSEKLDKHACFVSLAGENFKCSCSQTFTKTSAFKNHIGDKPFSCCSCSMQFNTVTNLVRHIRTHTKQKPYICKDCGRGFSQSAHLRNHSSTHLGIRAIKCNECNFSCKTFNGLLKHKKKHKDGFINHQNYVDGRKKSTNTTSCPICNKQFLFKRNMGMHMKIHNNKVSLCTVCGKVFDSKGKLTSHYKACHREPSVCKTCGKVFASAVLLSAHEKIHVSNKLFSCNVCHKTFSIKNYLAQHMKTHNNKKQFSCSKCGKLFKVAVSLKYHSNICVSLNIPV